MTREDAMQFVTMADWPSIKAVVEWITFRGKDGDCSVIVEPIYAEQQIYSDAYKMNAALSRLVTEFAEANDRYFTISEAGLLLECDHEAWSRDALNRENARLTIDCSPEIEAEILFLGHVWAIAAQDGELRLWVAGFCKKRDREHFGNTAFRTFDRAKEFVDRFIALGCPAYRSFDWTGLMTEFQAG
jgi:hypothetical protein